VQKAPVAPFSSIGRQVTIEFSGAIYQVMCRHKKGKQKVSVYILKHSPSPDPGLSIIVD
jgi:hypothetical protein